MGEILELVRKEVVSFEDFWRWYPRHVAKKDALRAWDKLTPNQQAQVMDVLPAFFQMWEKRRHEINFCPHPSTWLNGERWEDEIVEVSTDPCGWTGCRSVGNAIRGVRRYCDKHFAALSRGETP